MKLLVDAQLPPSLAATLRQAGFAAVAVRDIGLRDAKDSVIWNYALQNNAAILTKDEDFAERCAGSPNPPVVVWLRIGNASNPALLAWFLPMVPAVLKHIAQGDRLIEVR